MKRNLLISFLFLITMLAIMRWQGSSLITPQSPAGILNLELAKAAERLFPLRLFWNHETVLQNIYLDFLLVISYTWFLVTACKAVKNDKSPIFSGLVISAAAFNILENFLMILVWNERFGPAVLPMIFYIACIKFLLIAIVAGYLILSLFGLFKKESSV